eukprot:TRINITY_DN11282_c0_g2_i3.p1 TRINITY_DN11282_c0_g2~~TRINITY_DN11282_c0_g2_i3.p1  ORF type:complete len:115 (-),score=4.74 TRINITY_DN11282_c0_g2_i3:2234-2578(-)
MAFFSILKRINGSDLDIWAHKVHKIRSNGSRFFLNILRSLIDQWLKFEPIIMFGPLHVPNCSNGDLLAQNSREKAKKWTVQNHMSTVNAMWYYPTVLKFLSFSLNLEQIRGSNF